MIKYENGIDAPLFPAKQGLDASPSSSPNSAVPYAQTQTQKVSPAVLPPPAASNDPPVQPYSPSTPSGAIPKLPQTPSSTIPTAPSFQSTAPPLPGPTPNTPFTPNAPLVAPGSLMSGPTDVTSGIDTGGLLPDNFSVNDLQTQAFSDAPSTPAQQYIDQNDQNASGPTQWNVTPDQTVQGQYAGLIQKGNPAIEATRQQVLRSHAASGGGNDLMAHTAANEAGSAVALQIATQDAHTYAQAGQYNADEANKFAMQRNAFIESSLQSQQAFDQGVSMLHDQVGASMQQLYGQVVANSISQSGVLKSKLATIQASTNATMAQMNAQFGQNVFMAGVNQNNALEQINAQENASKNLADQKFGQQAYLNQENQQFTLDQLSAQQQNALQQAGYNADLNNAAEFQKYGMNVRMQYLNSINQNQLGLMQTIAEIRSNPNINTSQANAGIQSAVDQFNSFVTMTNAYYGAMVPGLSNPSDTASGGAAANDGQYNDASYNYQYIDAANFPNISAAA